MTTSVYPLAWPPHFQRRKQREPSRFKASLPAALDNVRRSISLFAKDTDKPVSGIVISSNYSLGDTNPEDPGVAVYFQWDGLNVCIPVDRYNKIEGNLQAIHHIVEGRRVELRHGSLQLIRATFQGFVALPAPGGKPWREVLGIVGNDLPEAERVYRLKAASAHPDNKGSHDEMAELNLAIAAARQELRT
jgi:hypothetical protein